MTELLVGLIAVLALFAGLLQLASLCRAHTEACVEARRLAGEQAMLEAQVLSSPEYILDWDPGPDGRRHTRDDRPVPASPAGFRLVIVDRAGRDASDWELINTLPEGRLSALNETAAPQGWLGLVSGHDSRPVEILPAVRSLLYRADSLDVEATVWMTQTRGVY